MYVYMSYGNLTANNRTFIKVLRYVYYMTNVHVIIKQVIFLFSIDSPIKDDAITTGDIMSKDTKCDDLLKESNTTTVSEEDDTLIQYSTSDDQGQEEKEEMEDAVVTMDTNNNDNTTSDNISNINTKDDGLPPEEEEEEEDHEGTEDLNKAMDTNNTVSVEEKEVKLVTHMCLYSGTFL